MLPIITVSTERRKDILAYTIHWSKHSKTIKKLPLAGVAGSAESEAPAADRDIGALKQNWELLGMGASPDFVALGTGASDDPERQKDGLN